MANASLNNVDIFDDRDWLDRSVETYEEEVPLLAQIGLGFTPQGIAIDAAETAKYGRDAYRDFSGGDYKSGLINTGIAGLSALGAIPFVGDVIKHLGTKSLKKGLLALPPPPAQQFKAGQPVDERIFKAEGKEAEFKEVQKAFNSVQNFKNSDEMFETAKGVNPNFQNEINKIAGDLNHRTVGNPGETRLSIAGDTAEREGKLIYAGRSSDIELDEIAKRLDPKTGQPFGQIKGKSRIDQKSWQKYGGDINQTTDPIRTRIIVNTAQESDEVANVIGKKYEVIDSGNQVNQVGMRDRKINIRYTDPDTGQTMIGEIGVTTLPMHKAAELAHDDYDHVRTILTEFGGFNKIPDQMVPHIDDAMTRMTQHFNEADKLIDSSWLDLGNIKTYRYGGQVLGNSGKSFPMTPNSFSKSGLDSFPPFAHSASNSASAGSQDSAPDGIYHSDASFSPRTTTDGTPSQLKYKFPDIITSPSNIINNYKNKSTFINSIDKPLSGGRKEIM